MKKLIAVIATCIICIIAVIVIVILNEPTSTTSPKPPPQSSPTPTPTPTPTPKPPSPSPAPQPTETPSEPESTATYTNGVYEYSLDYPQSWKVTDLGGMNVFITQPSKRAHAAIEILKRDNALYKTHDIYSPEDLINYEIDKASEYWENVTLISNPKSFTFEGLPACQVHFTYKDGAEHGSVKKVIVQKGDYFYKLDLWTKQKDTYEAKLDAIFDSYRFT